MSVEQNWLYENVYKNLDVKMTNCKGVELEAGYSADRIGKLTGGTELTADTTAEQLKAGTLFYINSPAGLKRLSDLVNASGVNSGSSLVWNTTVYLTQDIDMCGIDWMPIGTRPNGNMNAGRAEGIRFDGQGYTISNLICAPTYAESAAVGLFGGCYDGIIRNVVLDESCTFVSADSSAGNQSTGAILAYNGGMSVVNCKSSANVFGQKVGGITGGGPAGGIKGSFFCTNYGTVRGYAQGAGINGGIDDSACAMNCVNYGLVQSVSWAAGITNGFRGGHQIRNNVNYGTVFCTNGGYCAGIAVANNVLYVKGYHAEIRNNTNYGITSQSANSSGAQCDQGTVVAVAANGTNAIANGTTNAVVCDNKTVGNYIGYNASKINKVPASVMAEIADVTEVWTIADGAVNLVAGYTEAPQLLKITDKAGMRVLSAVVYFGNNLRNTTIYLANDIDMSGMVYDATDLTFSKETTFLPIGHIDGSLWTDDNSLPINVQNFGGLTQEAGAAPTYTKYFSGNFDGQGYAIKNWTVDNSSANGKFANRIGLFGLVHNGTVQNVVFDASNRMTNASDERCRMTGVVVQATLSGINNVWNRSDWMKDITAANGGVSGGIVAFASLTNIASCTNDGAVVNGIRGSGGIVGWGYNSVGIANCRNNGEVSSTYRDEDHPEEIPSMNIAGGILGTAGIYNNHTRIPRIVNCVNNGVVTVGDPVTVGETTHNPWGGSIVGFASASGQIRTLNVVDYANADLGLCGQNRNFNTGAIYPLFGTPAEDEMLDEMLHTRYQAKDTETVGDKTVQDIRLLATVDAAANYSEAGFILTNAEGKQAKVTTTTAYSSLLAMTEDGEETCNPNEYGACTSQYFFAVVLNDVEEGTFTAQSYVITQDGTYLFGDVLTIDVPAAVN